MQLHLIRTIRNSLGTLAALSALGVMSAAHAQNDFTTAGASVEGRFTLTYSVDGTTQPQIDNTASPTTFTVDRLVDLAVSYQANADDATVAPGAQNEELIFLLRNDGNDNFAYALSAFNESTGTDPFDTLNLEINYYVDDNDGLFEPGGDDGSASSYSAATPDLAADRILWIEVVGDIPASQGDGSQSVITLVADTLYPTAWAIEVSTGGDAGTAIAADDGTNAVDSVADNVLADGTNSARESENAGDYSDAGTFQTSSPDLTGSKTVSVIATNLAGTFDCAAGDQVSSDEYAVPGACVEYRIEIVNAGSADAALTAISDTLPDEVEFIGATFTNFTGGTAAQPNANTDCASGACVISQTGGSIQDGVTASIVIRAEVK